MARTIGCLKTKGLGVTHISSLWCLDQTTRGVQTKRRHEEGLSVSSKNRSSARVAWKPTCTRYLHTWCFPEVPHSRRSTASVHVGYGRSRDRKRYERNTTFNGAPEASPPVKESSKNLPFQKKSDPRAPVTDCMHAKKRPVCSFVCLFVPASVRDDSPLLLRRGGTSSGGVERENEAASVGSYTSKERNIGNFASIRGIAHHMRVPIQ